MTPNDPRKLPKFENPPVKETVLGLQFDPIGDLTASRLGVFAESLGRGWRVDEQPQLPTVIEAFAQQRVTLPLNVRKLSRLRITNAKGDRMIQVQYNRFHYNWLGQAGPPYPTYDVLRPEFQRYFDLFREFLTQRELGNANVNHWEVTYVNNFPRSAELWNNAATWSTIMPKLFASGTTLECGPLESFGGEWHFQIKPELGRLHVGVRHARGTIQGKDDQMLILTLTARGAVGVDKLTWEAGLDKGRETIVTSFVELTSNSAHKLWGLHYGSAD